MYGRDAVELIEVAELTVNVLSSIHQLSL